VNYEKHTKLDALRANYAAVTGRPFTYFFCPILFRDEDTDLSEGHVVNLAFGGSARRTTLQRKDVDNFFGYSFEADFVLLAEKDRRDAVDTLLDPRLARQLRATVIVDGKPVEHYRPRGSVPPTHSELLVEREGRRKVRLALKMEPSEVLSALNSKWEIKVDKDIRLAALVSLLKSAHLTLFSLVGYSYALSAGGYFLGWDVLGRFAAANLPEPRDTMILNAGIHFAEFKNLVRPMVTVPTGLTGTISDRLLFLCTGTPKPWAFMVLVRTGDKMHAVLAPILEDPESAARYVRFLRDPAPRFEIRLLRFAGDRWDIAKDARVIEWPNAAFD